MCGKVEKEVSGLPRSPAELIGFSLASSAESLKCLENHWGAMKVDQSHRVGYCGLSSV